MPDNTVQPPTPDNTNDNAETVDAGGNFSEFMEEANADLIEAEIGEGGLSEDDSIKETSSGTVFSELRGIIAELNLGSGHLIGLIVVLVLLGAIIIASFYFLFAQFGDDEVRTIEREEIAVEDDSGPGFFERLFGGNSDEEPVDSGVGVQEDGSQDDLIDRESELIAVNELGRNSAVPSTEAANLESSQTLDVNEFAFNILLGIGQLGEPAEIGSRLSFYTRTFRRIRNTFNTDLFAFLDAAIDRQAAYDQFLRDFKAFFATATLAAEDLRQDVGSLSDTLDRIVDDLEVAEEQFLAAADNLESERLPELLQRFQDLAAQRSIVLAELKAREMILERYEAALPIVANKIQAIELNERAFVQAVKVIDFEQIDLDLVIESEG